MIVNVVAATAKSKELNIPAVQAIMERLTMPCIRKWMKSADRSLLSHNFVETIHNKEFAIGTLGAAYKQWLATNNLVLNPISEKATRFEGDPVEKLFVSNIGIVHDLLHVTWGYGIDTRGEAQMAAWTHGNLADQGQRLMLWAYALLHPWVTPSLIRAYRLGLSIEKATQIDWEKRASLPLKAKQ
jgi:ubiquinone biosynthesis protein Coq4